MGIFLGRSQRDEAESAARSTGSGVRPVRLIGMILLAGLSAGCTPSHGVALRTSGPTRSVGTPAPASTLTQTAPASTPTPTAPDASQTAVSPTAVLAPATTQPAAVAAGTTVAPGLYKCMAFTFSQYNGGNLAGTGYDLIIESGNSYRSSLGTDSPGTMSFSDATHFTFSGGFLAGSLGDYVPGPTGHIDYHPPDKSGRFGCYPSHS